MTTSHLTANQSEALRLVADRRVAGVCIRYVWTYTAGSANVSRPVRALLRKGLVDQLTFSGGLAAINLTDAGRRTLSEILVREQENRMADEDHHEFTRRNAHPH